MFMVHHPRANVCPGDFAFVLCLAESFVHFLGAWAPVCDSPFESSFDTSFRREIKVPVQGEVAGSNCGVQSSELD